jgi:hypothetical protein
MAGKIYDTWNGLPTWAKGVIAVGGIAVIVLTARGIVARIRKRKELEQNLQESNTASDEVRQLESQGIKPTMSNSEFQAIINSHKEAMNGCGTDEQRIYDQFNKLKNEADVKKLISMWQVQYYQPCAASQPISYTKYLWDDKSFGGSISEWLNYEMTTTEIAKINSVLQSKGIRHKF